MITHLEFYIIKDIGEVPEPLCHLALVVHEFLET
jgi:hypothetical protein